MANFCRNCGAPLGANFAFCPQCRTPAAGGANPTAAPASAAPLAPAAKSGSGMKILLVILCVLALGGVAVVGGLFYVAHRVKQAVVAKASEYGVDLPSRRTGPSTASIELARHPCDLLTKEEAANLLGEPIDRTDVRSGSCSYYGPIGLSARLSKESMSAMVNKPNASVTGAEVADTVDRFMKSAAAEAVQADGNGDYPLVTITVLEDGRAQMAAIRAGKAIFSGIQGAGEEIPGLGDRSIRLANLGLNVLKGDTLIRILPGPVPGANRKCVALARTMLPRM
jgi:hypothetical protein